MATPDGKVAFEAGGKGYTLQFTTNALCALEDKAGDSYRVALELAAGADNPLLVSKKTLRFMFWAGVVGGSLTLEQAGDLVDAIGHRRATEIAREAFDAAFPDMEEAKGDEDPPKGAAG